MAAPRVLALLAGLALLAALVAPAHAQRKLAQAIPPDDEAANFNPDGWSCPDGGSDWNGVPGGWHQLDCYDGLTSNVIKQDANQQAKRSLANGGCKVKSGSATVACDGNGNALACFQPSTGNYVYKARALVSCSKRAYTWTSFSGSV